MLTQDVMPLRLAHHILLQLDVPHGTLIHDLQNHDEITYQLFDLGSRGDIEFEGMRVNAMQPGVFAVSAWDLVGALPIPEETVRDRTADGDFRWLTTSSPTENAGQVSDDGRLTIELEALPGRTLVLQGR